jgi:hypothetical protein
MILREPIMVLRDSSELGERFMSSCNGAATELGQL